MSLRPTTRAAAACRCAWIASVALVLVAAGPVRAGDADAAADRYVKAVEKLNDEHARKPGDEDEAALAAKLPAAALEALDALLAEDLAPPTLEALVRAGEAALDLDRVEDFERIRARLLQVAPGAAAPLGIALSRPRFLARGLDGVEPAGLAAVADAFDEVLDAYDRVFGFAQWSKVPGKKLRLRVHLVPEITRPPHFAPQFPWHSEIDFPVIEADKFSSPTAKGQFLLYGLAHELGHVIAMWGDRSNEQDHHAWAHYTGVAIVEHLSKERADASALKACRDARWRTLSKERGEIDKAGTKPGRKDRDGVMALLVALHDLVGPAAIGEALNALDGGGKARRVNHVRYYDLDDFQAALLATKAGKKHAWDLRKLFT